MDKHFLMLCLLFVIIISIIIADPYFVLIMRKKGVPPCYGALITQKHVVTASTCVCYSGENATTLSVLTLSAKAHGSLRHHSIIDIQCEPIFFDPNVTKSHFGGEVAVLELKDDTKLPIQIDSAFPPEGEVLSYDIIQTDSKGNQEIRSVPFTVLGLNKCKELGITIDAYEKVCGHADVYVAPMPILGSPVVANNDKIVGIVYEMQLSAEDRSQAVFLFNDITRKNSSFLYGIIKQKVNAFIQNETPLRVRPAAETVFLPDLQYNRLRRDPAHEPYLVHITYELRFQCFGVLITTRHALAPADCVCQGNKDVKKFEVFSMLILAYSSTETANLRTIFCGNDYHETASNIDIQKTAIMEFTSIMYDPVEIDVKFPDIGEPIYYTMSRWNGTKLMKDVKFRAKLTTSCGKLSLLPGRNTCGVTDFRIPSVGVPIVSMEEKVVGLVEAVGQDSKNENIFSYIDITNILPFVKYHIDEAYFDIFRNRTNSHLSHRDFAASDHWTPIQQTKNLYDQPTDESYLMQIKIKDMGECPGILITMSHVLTAAECACGIQLKDISLLQYEFLNFTGYSDIHANQVVCYGKQETAVIFLDTGIYTPVRVIDEFSEGDERIYYTVYDHVESVIVRVLATVENYEYCTQSTTLKLYPTRRLCGKVIINDPQRRPTIGTPVISLDNRLIGVVFDIAESANKRQIFSYTDVTDILDKLYTLIPKNLFRPTQADSHGLRENRFSADLSMPLEITRNLYDYPDDLPYLVHIRTTKNTTMHCAGVLITDTHILTLADCVCHFTKDDLIVLASDSFIYGSSHTYTVRSITCQPALHGTSTNHLSAVLKLVTNTFDPIRIAKVFPSTYALYYTVFNPVTRKISKILSFVEDEIYCKRTRLRQYPGNSNCGKVSIRVDNKQPELGTPVISQTNELVGLVFDVKIMPGNRTVFSYTNVVDIRPFLNAQIDKRLYRKPKAITEGTRYTRHFSADALLTPLKTTNLYDGLHDFPYLVFIREKISRNTIGSGVLITHFHVLTAYSSICMGDRDYQTLEIITEDAYVYFGPVSIDIRNVYCEISKKSWLERSAIIHLLSSTPTPVNLIDEATDLSGSEYIYYTLFNRQTLKITKVLALYEDNAYCNNYGLMNSPLRKGCGKIIAPELNEYMMAGTPVLTRDNRLIGVEYEMKTNSNNETVFAFTNINTIRSFLKDHINPNLYSVRMPENKTLSDIPFSADVPLHKRKTKVDNPFLVLFKQPNSEKPDCTGALITPTIILTLSSCVCTNRGKNIQIYTSSTYLFKDKKILHPKKLICEPKIGSLTNEKAKIAIVKINLPRDSPIELSFYYLNRKVVSYVVPFVKNDRILVKSLPAESVHTEECTESNLATFDERNNCLRITWNDGSNIYPGTPVITNSKLSGLVYDIPGTRHNGSTIAYVDLFNVQTFIFDNIKMKELNRFLEYETVQYTIDPNTFTSSKIDIFSKPTKLYDYTHYSAKSFSYLVLISGYNEILERCHGFYVSLRHVMTSSKCMCFARLENEVQTYQMYYRKLQIYKPVAQTQPETVVCPNQDDHPSAMVDLSKSVAIFTLNESLALMPDMVSRINVAHKADVPVVVNTTVYYLQTLRTKESLLYDFYLSKAIIVDREECIANGIHLFLTNNFCAKVDNRKNIPLHGTPLLTEDNDVFGVVTHGRLGANNSEVYIGYSKIDDVMDFYYRVTAAV
ncbi:uncharacterized protein [Prorops nasuta]|uniref:uncharacterized protein n=1 Tax=Prorops nasuta TaxID=863751 RepID=UPI0034CFC48A